MRVATLPMRIAMLAALAVVGSSCHTAQKPVSVVPPGTAPQLTAKAPAAIPERSQSAKLQPAAQEQNQSSAGDSPEGTAVKPASDSVGDLVSSVEKEYQAGLANYQAGHTDAAKQNFDNAFNALLESKLDIRSDDRLEKEFERIAEGVNQMSLRDLASASEAQNSEPAPIDETNGITPSADPTVRAKAQAEVNPPPPRRSQRAGQGSGRSEINPLRPAAYDDGPGCRLHQLLLQSRAWNFRACLCPLRPLSRHDGSDPQAGRSPSGFDLPGPSRIRIPADRGFPRRCPRNLAIHGKSGTRLWPAEKRLGRRPPGSREIHSRCGPPS